MSVRSIRGSIFITARVCVTDIVTTLQEWTFCINPAVSRKLQRAVCVSICQGPRIYPLSGSLATGCSVLIVCIMSRLDLRRGSRNAPALPAMPRMTHRAIRPTASSDDVRVQVWYSVWNWCQTNEQLKIVLGVIAILSLAPVDNIRSRRYWL